jgi:hypothetical protein
MQIKLFFLTLSLLLVITGCGKIEEESASGTIEYENENYAPNQTNTCYDDYANSAGCFGSKQYFGDEEITNGIWSVYTKSNNYLEYYDKYQISYQFMSDGSIKQRSGSRFYYYNYTDVWGVNDDGSALNLHPTTSYTISASRTGGCYTVTSGENTYRMCNEPLISDAAQNSAGYYGADVSFGNNDVYGNYTASGSWRIDDRSVTLDANGSTSTGGEWGLSQDAKMISIDGISYLINTYPDNNCIETYEMSGDYPTEPRTLCKE